MVDCRYIRAVRVVGFYLDDMAVSSKVLYEFGPFRVDPDKQVLLREGELIPVTPKTFETLLILVRHGREVVSKDDLMKELWPDSFVEESNLSQNIFMLRKALGDTPEDKRYIVTLPGKGYRFAAEVHTVTQEGEDVVIASRTRSEMVVEQPEVAPAVPLLALPAQEVRRVRWGFLAAAGLGVALLIGGTIWLLRPRAATVLAEKDWILLADFTNTTGDPLFNDTLRQGLAVQLEQSPFLRLVSEDRIQQTLALMGQPRDAPLTPALAREVCERTNSAAVLEGSITNLGSQYVLGLRAKSCRTGDTLADEQAQAAQKEDVLKALGGMAANVRSRLGESLATVKQHNVPLEMATTSSLEALQAYSDGLRVLFSTGDAAALPLFQRAVAIDSNFAMAYAFMGRIYGDLGEAALSAESTSKAYALRKRISDQERFWITTAYDTQVTENLEKAQQTCEVWAQTYPGEVTPHTFLAGIIYPVFGKYQQAVVQAGTAIDLDPNYGIASYILAWRYQDLNRFEDARKTLRDGEGRLNLPHLLLGRYNLAFATGDEAEMDKVVALSRENAAADEWVSDPRSFVLAYSGHVQEARTIKQHAIDLAQLGGHRETAALYKTGEAVWEAFYGNASLAKQLAEAALTLSNNRGVEYGAALAFALSGDSARAQKLADDLEWRFPEDTSVRFSYLPVLRARLALNHGNPEKAIELLTVAVPNELGSPRIDLHANFGALYPVYTRGEAFLAAHKGAEAAAEFQKIIDHRGIVGSDTIGALARLQLGRADAMQGDLAEARAAYEDFLTLWKDADPDVRILKQAKAEYAKLQ